MKWALAAVAAGLRGQAATEYWGAVWVGTPPQKYNVLFDTGSGNLVLPGVACKDTACQLHHRYNPKASSSAWVHDGDAEQPSKQLQMFGLGDQSDVSVAFGSGAVAAQMVTDKMCLAKDAGCTKLDMLMSTEESTVFATLGADGVLGLGFPDLAVTGQFSALSALSERGALPKNMFSVALAETGSHGSMITFGGYREDQIEGKLSWASTVDASGYWVVNVAVRGENELPGSRAVIDTGSSVVAAPAAAVKLLKETKCEKAPDLYFEVDGAKLKLPAKAYRPACDTMLLAPLDEAATADTADVLSDAWVLGDPFLRHFVTVFDVDGHRVGFAKPRRTAGLLARRTSVRKEGESGLLSIPLERRVHQ
jgi:hypothetical protein